MNPPSARSGSRLAALALCGLLAAGCSDSEGAGDGDSGESELAANARAAAVNVQLTDLPEGYAAIPASADEQGGDDPTLDGCVEDLGEVTVAEAESPTFRLASDAGITSFVASETSVLSDPEPAERLIASVQEPPILDCLSRDLGEVLASILPGATAETTLMLAPDPNFPDVGEASVQLAGSATFTMSDEAAVSISVSLVFLQTNEVLSVLLFGGIPEPFPPETLRSLVNTIANRQS